MNGITEGLGRHEVRSSETDRLVAVFDTHTEALDRARAINRTNAAITERVYVREDEGESGKGVRHAAHLRVRATRMRPIDTTNLVIGADTDTPGDIEHPVVRIWCYEGKCGQPHGGTAVGVPNTAQSLASLTRQAEAHWTEHHA